MGDTPEIPQNPKQYAKAVTIGGIHHVFPPIMTHLEAVEDLGKTPQDVEHYWGWNPYQGRWETFDDNKPAYERAWEFNSSASDEEGWENDLHKGFLDRVNNPASDEAIIKLLSPKPKLGVYQKGLELPDATRFFWTPDEFGFPHHDEVARALKATEGLTFLEVDEDGKVRDAHDYENMDWSF